MRERLHFLLAAACAALAALCIAGGVRAWLRAMVGMAVETVAVGAFGVDAVVVPALPAAPAAPDAAQPAALPCRALPLGPQPGGRRPMLWQRASGDQALAARPNPARADEGQASRAPPGSGPGRTA